MELRAPGIYLKALQRALAVAGGRAALCERLGVPMPRLQAWLEGAAEPPLDVFLRTVDIISTPPSRIAEERLAILQRSQQELAERTASTLERTKQLLEAVQSRRLSSALCTALAATGAERGNIQIAGPGGLTIAVQVGFAKRFLDFFACVNDGRSACGAAMQKRARLVVPDVDRDAIFAGTEAREVMLDAGARAVQSTPLIARSGALLGMLSTHYERPYRPSEDELQPVDHVAADTAKWLETTA
jgi:transcriptional regulator with XRE-family HTH domain